MSMTLVDSLNQIFYLMKDICCKYRLHNVVTWWDKNDMSLSLKKYERMWFSRRSRQCTKAFACVQKKNENFGQRQILL